ncbi:MAG: hypothetical protein AAGA48_38105 [Myxococcota bacterium]
MIDPVFTASAAGAVGAVATLGSWVLRSPPVPAEVPYADHIRFRAIYRIARREFGPAAWGAFPPGVHRFDTDAYLASLLFIRDVYLADGVVLTRGEREVLASGVSMGNECYFCSNNHFAITQATEGAPVANALRERRFQDLPTERLRLLANYGFRSKDASDPLITETPFALDEQSDAAAVLFAFHYINRVMDTLGPIGWVGDFMAKPPPTLLANGLRAHVSMQPEALAAIRAVTHPIDVDATVSASEQAEIRRWSGGASRQATSDAVITGWAALVRVARQVLGDRVVEAVRDAMGRWNGSEAPLLGPWAREAVGVLQDDPRALALAEQAMIVGRASTRMSSPRARAALFEAAGRDRRIECVLVAFAACTASLRILSWQPTPRGVSRELPRAVSQEE